MYQPTDEQIEALARDDYAIAADLMGADPDYDQWPNRDLHRLTTKRVTRSPAFQAIIRAAQAQVLREAAADNVRSWGAGGWLSCADKCGRVKCRDDVRVDAAHEVRRWLEHRAARIEEATAP